MGTRKHYTREFKLQAARLVVQQGYTYADAARQLGTTSWSIRDWARKFRAEGILPAADQPAPEADELKRLRRENSDLRMENEILKKATAYFAKDQL